MLLARISGVALVLLGTSFLAAQDGEKIASGPKVGAFLPGQFECYNVNGSAAGRPRCLVCYFGLNPAVLAFVKEPAAGKDEAINDLVKKLEEVAVEFQDRDFSVGVIFLSPDARDSTNNAQETDAAKVIQETVKREELYKRLKERADKLKHVIVACCVPEGPKGYNLNPKAEATILYYERMKVKDNWTFAPDALKASDVDGIVKKLRETLPLKRKKGEVK